MRVFVYCRVAHDDSFSLEAQAVLASKVDMVLVNSIDRIGREWGMTQAYIDLLTQHKVKLLCIRDRLLFDKQGVTYF